MKNCDDCIERIDRAIKMLEVMIEHYKRLIADIKERRNDNGKT